MPSQRGTRGYVFGVILLSVLASARPARADFMPSFLPASISDVFGVRKNSDPASLTPNQSSFSEGIVQDGTIKELSDGSDLIGTNVPPNVIQFNLINSDFCAAQQACLGNNAVVNLGVKGYAYLLEPPAHTDLSDRISIVFNGSGITGNNLIQVTITLDSDPFSSPITTNPAAAVNESGLAQDVSGSVFRVASDPTHPRQTVLASGEIPFHVLLQSDPDPVPEPTSLILLGTGILGLLGCHRRPQRTE